MKSHLENGRGNFVLIWIHRNRNLSKASKKSAASLFDRRLHSESLDREVKEGEGVTFVDFI